MASLMNRIGLVLVMSIAATAKSAERGSLDVRAVRQAGDFALVQRGQAAPVVVAASDYKVVQLAAADLAADVERVTGVRPVVQKPLGNVGGAAIIVGTLGHSAPIDRLVADGRLDIAGLQGAWESFVIATISDGGATQLVVAGSDRRGTAFGCYELSQAIGVSPWVWWADVAPAKKPALFVAAGTRRFGPPSVKYRGIFLNDEDWGLKPWAAQTFEPEKGNIGPKTYAKIFELMLRLKANTVWPAMHPGTTPFNAFPENKQVADDYAIVMGSSHAEPMLRNNVGEWTAPPQTYNYLTNREGVLKYWEERMRENGKFENIYTVGIRGVHDSNMQGPKTDPERIRVLEQVFADQRALIAKYVRPEVEQVPQMFCAYKEVLGLYRQGLKVPDDVTIVWPDDNFGYVRNFATAEERNRSGGFGVYYHLSYLGAPMAYLWLYTTPPALVWEEMTKAYDYGARTLWIANVGDLKPAEIGTEFFLEMAWDINRWRRDNLPQFLEQWAAREFGAAPAPEIAAIMREYYQLNFQRKPEHLQWALPKQPPRPSAFNDDEEEARLGAFVGLGERVRRVRDRIAPEQRDGFFELVEYPVIGSALANERFLAGEMAVREPAGDPVLARRRVAREKQRAETADAKLRALTDDYNERIAGGKWRRMIYLEPADSLWPSFRISKWEMPRYTRKPIPAPAAGGYVAVEAEHFTRKVDRAGAVWQVISGLGRTGDSVAVLPTNAPSIEVAKLGTDAPRLDYELQLPRSGDFLLHINLLPTQPIVAGRGLRFGLAVDDDPPREIVLQVGDGSAAWAQGVLNETVVATAHIAVKSAGAHTLHIYGEDPGVVLDKLVIDCGGLQPSYLGPPENVGAR
jgi:hypothetical protein